VEVYDKRGSFDAEGRWDVPSIELATSIHGGIGSRREGSARVDGGTPYNRRVHYVYIVRCADGTLYTGYARDPHARERMHNRGRGARYTAGRRPVCLVYAQACATRGEALSREHHLKRLSRREKEALIRAPSST
jgi:putative endonuclease